MVGMSRMGTTLATMLATCSATFESSTLDAAPSFAVPFERIDRPKLVEALPQFPFYPGHNAFLFDRSLDHIECGSEWAGRSRDRLGAALHLVSRRPDPILCRVPGRIHEPRRVCMGVEVPMQTRWVIDLAQEGVLGEESSELGIEVAGLGVVEAGSSSKMWPVKAKRFLEVSSSVGKRKLPQES